jgi:hypothetical protein
MISDAEDYLAKKTFVPYSQSFEINQTSTILAYVKSNEGQSGTVSATFFKKPNNFTIDTKSKYNPQYHAGGPEGLIDGIFGTENWRKGDWQGYQNQDFEAVIDMQATREISQITANFLQDTRSWILMPTKVEYYISDDNINFTLFDTQNNTIDPKEYNSTIKEFESNSKPVKARYVKVKATNFGKLPEWHQGFPFDGEAFIFIDEITIK